MIHFTLFAPAPSYPGENILITDDINLVTCDNCIEDYHKPWLIPEDD